MQQCQNDFKKYTHLKPVSEKIHLAGGGIDLLLGTDFSEAFVDVHSISGQPGEPIAKMNCFGWYILGQLVMSNTRIQSIDVGTLSVVDDLNILLQQDLIGVKPTELCMCSDRELRENKFVKSLAESTTLVDGRVQVRMPWILDNWSSWYGKISYQQMCKVSQAAKETSGSNYGTTTERTSSCRICPIYEHGARYVWTILH